MDIQRCGLFDRFSAKVSKFKQVYATKNTAFQSIVEIQRDQQ
jgi:hypothetical protein